MAQAKWIGTLALLGLLAVFAVQNMALSEFAFLIWSFRAPRFILIGVALMVGFLIGWLTHAARR